MKKLTDEIIEKTEIQVKLMLFASRDCFLNRDELDEKGFINGKWIWISDDGYYGEAFGIMRALVMLGYCEFGSNNTPTEKTNVKWWFDELKSQVFDEALEIGVKEGLDKYRKLSR